MRWIRRRLRSACVMLLVTMLVTLALGSCAARSNINGDLRYSRIAF